LVYKITNYSIENCGNNFGFALVGELASFKLKRFLVSL